MPLSNSGRAQANPGEAYVPCLPSPYCPNPQVADAPAAVAAPKVADTAAVVQAGRVKVEDTAAEVEVIRQPRARLAVTTSIQPLTNAEVAKVAASAKP